MFICYWKKFTNDYNCTQDKIEDTAKIENVLFTRNVRGICWLESKPNLTGYKNEYNMVPITQVQKKINFVHML